jgi:hypothetical protein
MEAGPTPWIIRYPGVAILGHYPVATCIIRAETAILIRRPNVAILWIVYPLPVRSKVLIKIVVRYIGIILCNRFYRRKAKSKKQDKRKDA